MDALLFRRLSVLCLLLSLFLAGGAHGQSSRASRGSEREKFAAMRMERFPKEVEADVLPVH
ncbi:MAG: hypothetical protein ACI4Q0_06630 [Oligosphaeraceae bacterium]